MYFLKFVFLTVLNGKRLSTTTKIEIVNQELQWVAWVKETYSFKNEWPQVLNLQLLLLQQELSTGRD